MIALRFKVEHEAVAWLANDAIAIPLHEGVTFIGRSQEHSEHEGWPRPYPVEGHQWFVRCEQGRVEVADAASTNQSVVLRGEQSIEIPWQAPAPLDRLSWTELREGDRLRTAYATVELRLSSPSPA